MDLVARGLNFPTSLTFDLEGNAYVAEAGLPFDRARPGGRILRIAPDGEVTILLEELRSPVNGLTFHAGSLLISEGGNPGRISRLYPQGEWSILVDGLPGLGNYHTNVVAVGPDDKLYFSQGAMTNSGVIGLDAFELGWLMQLPHNSDIPGWDVELAGVNFETTNPLSDGDEPNAVTGAFTSFNTVTRPGQRIPARVPCTAAIMRCNSDGSNLELVAWGLRNAYGLGFLPDGRLLALDQGADERGSRPIGNAPDLLFQIEPGKWYGWPDFIGAVPVTDRRFLPAHGRVPEFLLSNHDELPALAEPLLQFPKNSAATKFDLATAGPWHGQLVVALFGDEKPMTAHNGPRAGRSIVRVDPADWSLHPVNLGPFQRPIDVRFPPSGDDLWILDFGEFEIDETKRVQARAGSGNLWKASPAEYEPSAFVSTTNLRRAPALV